MALVNMAQLVGSHPTNWKVEGFIPCQGTCLGCRFGPQSGHMQEATNQCFSTSLSPSLPLFPKSTFFLKYTCTKKDCISWLSSTYMAMILKTSINFISTNSKCNISKMDRYVWKGKIINNAPILMQGRQTKHFFKSER